MLKFLMLNFSSDRSSTVAMWGFFFGWIAHILGIRAAAVLALAIKGLVITASR